MNIVILKGNLTKDPQVNTVNVRGKEVKVANLSIAVNRYFKTRDGEKSKHTVFVDLEAWDSGAEAIEKVLHKGDPVLIHGSLEVDTWEKDGQKRTKHKIRINEFEKLNRYHKDEEEVTSDRNDVETPVETPVGAGDDEIPF